MCDGCLEICVERKGSEFNHIASTSETNGIMEPAAG
jgi:hypothetical protein